MTIPSYQTLMLPVLCELEDGGEHRFRDVIDRLAAEFELSSEERNTLLPSGGSFMFDNRVGWARTYLKKAGLVDSPRRGYVCITERGSALLAQQPANIDNSTLGQYAEFQQFRQRETRVESIGDGSATGAQNISPEEDVDATPREQFDQAYLRLRSSIETELLDQVKTVTPARFERLVVDLLVAMGYGGSRQEAGSVTQMTGDEGIDGTIKEDKLGLDVIYVQAKKWESTVGRPEIQKFAGALQGQRAGKGVFITTSNFSREARDYVGFIQSKIILVDGNELVRLMVDHNVGVSPIRSYDLKRIDSDYFDDDTV